MGTGARLIALGVCVLTLWGTFRLSGRRRNDARVQRGPSWVLNSGNGGNGGGGGGGGKQSPSLLSRLTQGRTLWLIGGGLLAVILLVDWAGKSDDRAEASRWQAKHLEHVSSLPAHATGDLADMPLQGYRLDGNAIQVGVRRHLYCDLATAEVVEGATTVTVRVAGRAVLGLDPARYCRDTTADTIALVQVRLAAPLGTRTVVDGTTGRAVPLVTR
ncbi:MAG: hypothetical protein ACJ73S_23415 [Mycobacteriales bacterium]